MLEAMFRIYLGAFRYGGNMHDARQRPHRDSPSEQTALSSPSSNEGSLKECSNNGSQLGLSLSA